MQSAHTTEDLKKELEAHSSESAGPTESQVNVFKSFKWFAFSPQIKKPYSVFKKIILLWIDE